MKRCACGREYNEEQWRQLRLVGEQDDGAGGTLELRNCAGCRSTLSTPTIDRPTMIPLTEVT